MSPFSALCNNENDLLWLDVWSENSGISLVGFYLYPRGSSHRGRVAVVTLPGEVPSVEEGPELLGGLGLNAAVRVSWWVWGICCAFLFLVENLLFILQTLGAMTGVANPAWSHEMLTRLISLVGSQACSGVSGGVSGRVTCTLC